jgi:hypothetical protein
MGRKKGGRYERTVPVSATLRFNRSRPFYPRIREAENPDDHLLASASRGFRFAYCTWYTPERLRVWRRLAQAVSLSLSLSLLGRPLRTALQRPRLGESSPLRCAQLFPPSFFHLLFFISSSFLHLQQAAPLPRYDVLRGTKATHSQVFAQLPGNKSEIYACNEMRSHNRHPRSDSLPSRRAGPSFVKQINAPAPHT